MAGHGSFTCEKSIGIKQKMVVCFLAFLAQSFRYLTILLYTLIHCI